MHVHPATHSVTPTGRTTYTEEASRTRTDRNTVAGRSSSEEWSGCVTGDEDGESVSDPRIVRFADVGVWETWVSRETIQ